MRWSEDRILTTHTGSLPRPPELTRLYVRRARGGEVDPAELDRLGKEGRRQIVDKQGEARGDIGKKREQRRDRKCAARSRAAACLLGQLRGATRQGCAARRHPADPAEGKGRRLCAAL